MKPKAFVIKFIFEGNSIQTQMKTQNVSPQEALGLLDMAKSEILEKLSKGRHQMFSGVSKNE
ncbi:MAG: hypothetical protein ABIF40_05550 [archaeon]